MPTEVDLTSMPVNQDIEKYIDHMLFSATELKTWNPNAKELIKLADVAASKQCGMHGSSICCCMQWAYQYGDTSN